MLSTLYWYLPTFRNNLSAPYSRVKNPIRCLKTLVTGRTMAQAVSRRPSTAEARVRSQLGPCRICGGQSGTGTGSSQSTSVFPCQFHSTGAALLRKGYKNNNHLHLYRKVAQEALRLRCARSVCCGALSAIKKNLTTTLHDIQEKRISPISAVPTHLLRRWSELTQ
jgi:hypothetical protein